MSYNDEDQDAQNSAADDDKPVGPVQPLSASNDDDKPVGPVQPLPASRPAPTPQTVPMAVSHGPQAVPDGTMAVSHPQNFGQQTGYRPPVLLPHTPQPGPITQTVQALNQQAETTPDMPMGRRIAGGITRGVVNTLGFLPETAEAIAQGDNPGDALRTVYDRTVAPQVNEYRTAKREAEQGNTSQSMGHSIAAAIPFAGPLAAGIGERAGTGDVAGAAAEGLTYALAPKAIETVKGAPFEAPNTQELQAMGSTALDASRRVGSRVTRTVGNAVTTGAQKVNPLYIDPVDAFMKGGKPNVNLKDMKAKVGTGLPLMTQAASDLGVDLGDKDLTWRDGLPIVQQAQRNVWDQVSARMASVGNSKVPMSSVADAMRNIPDGWSSVRKAEMPGVIDNIHAVADAYDGQTWPIGEVENRIQELNNELRSQQSQKKVNENALRSDPAYAPKYAQLDALRGLQDSIMSDNGITDIRDLKRQYGALKDMEKVIEHNANVADRASSVPLFEGLGKIAGLSGVAAGVVTMNPAAVASGVAAATLGHISSLRNDRNWNFRQAMRAKPAQVQPFVNSEYMTEPGARSYPVPRFGQRQLGPMTRERGVPEQPNVDIVDPSRISNSKVPFGAQGRDGVLLRPAGLLPAARFPGEAIASRPLRIGGRSGNARTLPPISLPESHATPSNLEAVGMPETAEASAIQNAVRRGRGRFGKRSEARRD